MHRQTLEREGKQFGRFILVGLLNTAFGYGAYALFLYVGMHFAWASLLATVLGILFNFFTTGRIVFRNTNYRRIGRFFLVYGVVYLFNVMGLAIFDHLRIDLYLAGLLLIPPAAVIGYLLNRRFVFGGVE